MSSPLSNAAASHRAWTLTGSSRLQIRNHGHLVQYFLKGTYLVEEKHTSRSRLPVKIKHFIYWHSVNNKGGTLLYIAHLQGNFKNFSWSHLFSFFLEIKVTSLVVIIKHLSVEWMNTVTIKPTKFLVWEQNQKSQGIFSRSWVPIPAYSTPWL